MGREVVLYIAMSLDGYIAREDGALDWLPQAGGEDFGYGAFIEGVDTVVMGRTTFEQIINELSPDVWPYAGKRCLVATSRKHAPDGRAEFIGGDITKAVGEIQNTPGKNIWLVGGSKLAAAFIRKDMIDAYIITVVPVILGGGIPLFTDGAQADLKLESVKKIGDMAQLRYGRA